MDIDQSEFKKIIKFLSLEKLTFWKPEPASKIICWFSQLISKQEVCPPYFWVDGEELAIEPRQPWMESFISASSPVS